MRWQRKELTMQLSDQQKRFFNTFGYLVVPKLFTSSEIAVISEGFETSLARHGKDIGSAAAPRRGMLGPIEHLPEMNRILDDSRILGLIGGVLGEDFNYCSGDGSTYAGDTPWHPDGNWGELFAIKAAFYLDPVRGDGGALRVIPGSCQPDHVVRKLKIDPNKSMEQFGVLPKDFPGNVALDSDPGDVVIFNHDTYHAAFGGGSRRRMFTMNCTRYAHDPRTMEMLRKYVGVHSPGAHRTETGSGMYFSPFRQTAGQDRLRHFQQPDEIHDEIFPNHNPQRLQPA
jgi:hypothetical protein